MVHTKMIAIVQGLDCHFHALWNYRSNQMSARQVPGPLHRRPARKILVLVRVYRQLPFCRCKPGWQRKRSRNRRHEAVFRLPMIRNHQIMGVEEIDKATERAMRYVKQLLNKIASGKKTGTQKAALV